jgi:hypothetical protein
MNDDDVDENLNGFVIIIISRPFFVLFEGYSNIYCTGKLGTSSGCGVLRSNIPKGPSVTPSPFHFDWNWRGTD